MEETRNEYKIRHKVTGLYQNGGSMVTWSAKGKTWTSQGALSNHFNLISHAGMYCGLNLNGDHDDWEIETIIVKRWTLGTVPVSLYLESKKARKKS